MDDKKVMYKYRPSNICAVGDIVSGPWVIGTLEDLAGELESVEDEDCSTYIIRRVEMTQEQIDKLGEFAGW